MILKLYAKFGISDSTNFDRLTAADYPILSDLYALIDEEYKAYDESSRQLYTAEMLQNILLGLHSICKGAESKFFDGHTNITDAQFLIENINNPRNPSVLLAATRLLHRLENLFRVDYRRSAGADHIDRKRRRKLQEKKQAQGHKRDDHAPEIHL